ncbi:MAG: tetratricopeptide repeat protein [Geminicoccaceae bacterium]|nr:MAG: tetratricopeptide repeat protein [Geminicoccaceae bacterium]
MIADERGLGLTTTSEAAVRAFDDVLHCYLEYRLRIGPAIKGLLGADPEFVMGRVLVGYLMMARGTPEGVVDARKALEAAEAHAGDHLSRRERMHLAALQAWVGGAAQRACRIWEDILVAHPLDLLALRLAHFQSFWLGTPRRMRNVVVRALPAWDEHVPRYGDVLGMAAFGHEELGDYATAERLGRCAVALNGEDMWSIHAVAHVMEMQGRHGEGLSWLDFAPDRWADRAAMRTHIWWHKALFHFERGELDAALDLYDRSVDPGPDLFYIDIQNCASLLARIEFMGGDAGSRWASLAERAASWADNHQMAFTDVHTIVPLAREGRPEAQRHLASLQALASAPGEEARRLRDYVLPVCHGVAAFYAGDFPRCIDLLLPLKDDLVPLGGSHAQRDLFHLMLLESALRGGRFDLARSLAGERIVLREHGHGGWLKYAEALEGLGDVPAAAAARQRATF